MGVASEHGDGEAPLASEHCGGSGTPLLLLHGFTDTWRAWTPLLDALEAEHEVLAPTLPGHLGGPSLPDDTPVSLHALADVVEHRLDDAGWPSAHIAGSSLGGWLALELAARGRARSVVALCPAGGWEQGTREARRTYGYFARTHQSLKLATPPVARLVATRPRLRAVAFRELLAHPERLPPHAAYDMIEGARGCSVVVEWLALARREGPFGELAPIEIPVRIAYGERDWLIRWPGSYARLRRLLPNAEVVPLPECGHLAMWDDPELVARTILEVTRPVDARDAGGARLVDESGAPGGGRGT